MIFDEWWKNQDERYKAAMLKGNIEEAFEAGAVSRDAEIAELKRAMKFQATGNYDYQEELKEERDQLRKDVKTLREALIQERDLRVFGQSPECGKTHLESIRDMRCAVYSNTDEALAATEQKP